MADNTELNAGTGGDIISTDDIAGVKVQRVKVQFGVDGVANDVTAAAPLPVGITDGTTAAVVTVGGALTVDGSAVTQPVSDAGGSLTVDNAALSVVGGGAEATALRVTIADDSTGVVSVDDNGSSLTVDGSLTTVSTVTNLAQLGGTAISMNTGVRDAGTQRVTIATNDVVPVSDNSGSLTIDNAALSVTGGGVESGALRVTIANDSTGVVSVDDNAGSLTIDNATLSVTGNGTNTGALRVTVASDSTGTVAVTDGGGSLTVDGALTSVATITNVVHVDDNASTLSVDDGGGSLTIDNAALSVTGGGVEASALRVTIANDSTGVVSIDDNGGSLTVDGTVTANAGTGFPGVAVAGVGISGASGVVLVAADGGGLARVVASDSSGALSINDGGNTITIDGSLTGITNNVKVIGPTPSDSPISAAPVTVGGRASTAVPTAVSADGDVVNLWMDRQGAVQTHIVDGAGDSCVDATNNAVQTTVVTALPAGTNAIGKLAANSGVTIGAVEVAAAQTLDNVTTVGTITNVVHVDDNSGSLTVDYATTGSGTSTGALRVELPTNGTGTLATVSTVTSLTQMNGQAISMGTGVRDAGTQRVTIATNDAVPVTDNSGSLTVDNNGTFAVQAAGTLTNNNAAPSTNNIGALVGLVTHGTPQTLTTGRLAAPTIDLAGSSIVRMSPRHATILGDVVTAHRYNQIEINFSTAYDTTLITNTTANGGTATQGSGKSTLAVTSATNSTVTSVSVQTVKYSPGDEIFCYFTGAWPTAGAAGVVMRAGLFDTNNGFFVGYEGSNAWGFTVRQNAVDTTTALTSFNGDKCDGSAGSGFTRAGTPEAIDFTKLNIFRIRFSWLGAAPITLEVSSPDGHWVVMHTIRQPNSSANPSVYATSLSMQAAVTKTSGAGTYSFITACWAAGCSDEHSRLVDSTTDNTVVPTVKSVEWGTTALTGGTYVPALVTSAGARIVNGEVAHDAVDSGNPVKVGVKALSALPTAVATADRANAIGDLWGRQLTSHIDPAMQTWKSYNTTSTQTGTAVWTPTSGKKIAITHLTVGTYGTTAARLILWFGAGGDTTYTAGTDQLVLAASYAPTTTAKPGTVNNYSVPLFCTTADYILRITTDAALSVDVTVYGYEW